MRGKGAFCSVLLLEEGLAFLLRAMLDTACTGRVCFCRFLLYGSFLWLCGWFG